MYVLMSCVCRPYTQVETAAANAAFMQGSRGQYELSANEKINMLVWSPAAIAATTTDAAAAATDTASAASTSTQVMLETVNSVTVEMLNYLLRYTCACSVSVRKLCMSVVDNS
jgi:hypothetical protein